MLLKKRPNFWSWLSPDLLADKRDLKQPPVKIRSTIRFTFGSFMNSWMSSECFPAEEKRSDPPSLVRQAEL
jgi:hypothetical protein